MSIMIESERLAKEYGEEFDPESKRIKGPGKFEGEWLPVLFFYDAMMNGDGEETEHEGEMIFPLDEEERKDLSTEETHAALSIRSDGFVSLWLYTPKAEK